MRLWSNELEVMRPEARAAVETSGGPFAPSRPEPDLTGMSRDERVAHLRADMQASTFAIDDTEEREIAGVRCRIFRPHAPGARSTSTSTAAAWSRARRR